MDDKDYLDTDGDGIGDNSDNDIDGDGESCTRGKKWDRSKISRL